MRAKKNVYHLECFACQLCSQRFCVGDRFYLCDNKIVCQYDYEEIYGIGATTGTIDSLAYSTTPDVVLASVVQPQQPVTTTMTATATTTTIINDPQMAREPERIPDGQCVAGEPHLTALMSSSSAPGADLVVTGERREVDRPEAAPRATKLEESSHDERAGQSSSGETFGRCLLSGDSNNREPQAEAGR